MVVKRAWALNLVIIIRFETVKHVWQLCSRRGRSVNRYAVLSELLLTVSAGC